MRRVFPSGWTYSTALIDITLADGQSTSGLAIGSAKVGSVPPPTSSGATLTGFCFNDTDKDGVYDANEVKTSGKKVFLDTNNNGTLDAGEQSVVTDAAGRFAFTGLSAGTYHVRRVFPSGYTYSTPLADVVLAMGQTSSDVAIGSKPTS